MAITQKILEIQRTLEVEKTGYDERNDFYYFSADDVANAVRAKMNEHGVIHRTTITDLREDNFFDTNGRNRPRVTFQATVTFIDAEDGSEFSTDVVATGSDTGGDKATRKAAVQAFKVACIDLFVITEEMGRFDSDGDKEAEPVATETAAAKKASTAELFNRVTAIINDESNPITGADAGKVGNRIAAELGFEPKGSVWRKEAAVLERVIADLEAGVIE